MERLPIPTEKHPRARESRFRLLKADPYHPSLHFKKIGDLWSVRVGIHHRALGVDVEGGVLWLWIGTHANTTGLRGKLRGRAYRLDHFNERVFALKLLSQRWSDRWSKTHTLAASAFRAGAALATAGAGTAETVHAPRPPRIRGELLKLGIDIGECGQVYGATPQATVAEFATEPDTNEPPR